MHITKENSIVYPYSIRNLKKDYPQVSFPNTLTNETLSRYGVYTVVKTDKPNYDPILENIEEHTPENIEGVWRQRWLVTKASDEQIESRLLEIKKAAEESRAEAYRLEADPLFFRWQRGDGTEQEWLDKVAEIKARYPYPEA